MAFGQGQRCWPLLSRQRTGLKGTGGIKGIGTLVNVANNALFIDHEGHTVGKEASETENPIGLGHLFIGVTQQRETRAGFLSKLAVPILAVETNPQHLCARSLKLGDITLIRLDLLRSTRCRGANIKG